jgi:hydrogenase maturation factor HypF (carbamoyltransferase family)
MCETCGCTVTQTGTEDAATVEVMGRLLNANDRVAAHNRDHFNSHRVVAFNLMSSPGAGKTALLEATIDALKADRASIFHSTLAELLLAQARVVRAECGVSHLGLAGGVFQNRMLCERVLFCAQPEGFTVHIPERLPCNDAGISFGQIIEASARP